VGIYRSPVPSVTQGVRAPRAWTRSKRLSVVRLKLLIMQRKSVCQKMHLLAACGALASGLERRLQVDPAIVQ
jgi:hypothetical protein